MARLANLPKQIGPLVEQIERIREELHTIQRHGEKVEPANTAADGRRKRKQKEKMR